MSVHERHTTAIATVYETPFPLPPATPIAQNKSYSNLCFRDCVYGQGQAMTAECRVVRASSFEHMALHISHPQQRQRLVCGLESSLSDRIQRFVCFSQIKQFLIRCPSALKRESEQWPKGVSLCAGGATQWLKPRMSKCLCKPADDALQVL